MTQLHVGDFTVKKVYGRGMPLVYGEALVELARERPEILCISADLSSPSEVDMFADIFPDRFYNVGIAEANMIGIASGLAKGGDMPFVHSFSVFATRRCYDQLAMQVAYPRTNVKIVGFLPGLTTLLGVSHQAIDDIALMRALPNMTIIEPAGPQQMRAAVRAAAQYDGPVYLRLKRADKPVAEAERWDLELGRGQLVRSGRDGVIFACGLMVEAALEAATTLAQQGQELAVANIHTIKPLDTGFVIDLAKRCKRVLTAENHSVIGGLGSAVAETLLEAAVNVRFARVGVQDTFAEGASTPYLLKKYGLSAEHIVAAFEQLKA